MNRSVKTMERKLHNNAERNEGMWRDKIDKESDDEDNDVRVLSNSLISIYFYCIHLS